MFFLLISLNFISHNRTKPSLPPLSNTLLYLNNYASLKQVMPPSCAFFFEYKKLPQTYKPISPSQLPVIRSDSTSEPYTLDVYTAAKKFCSNTIHSYLINTSSSSIRQICIIFSPATHSSFLSYGLNRIYLINAFYMHLNPKLYSFSQSNIWMD